MSSTNDSNDPVSVNALNTSTTQADMASTANQQAGDSSSARYSQHILYEYTRTVGMSQKPTISRYKKIISSVFLAICC